MSSTKVIYRENQHRWVFFALDCMWAHLNFLCELNIILHTFLHFFAYVTELICLGKFKRIISTPFLNDLKQRLFVRIFLMWHDMTTCSQHVHYKFMTCSQHGHNIFTTCSQHVHVICSQHVCTMLTKCSSHVHHIFTTFSPHVHHMLWTYKRHVHHMFITFSSHVHNMWWYK